MDWLMEIEMSFILFLQQLGNWLEVPFQGFTFLGNELFFLLVMPAIYWSINPQIGFRAGMMLVLSGGLNSCVKMLFHSPRPYWVDARVQALSSETSFGIPSGHAQNSAAIWGIIATSIRKKWALAAAAVVVFFIGLSRLYLGVHFIRDVLVGWLIGALLVVLYLKLEKPTAKWLAARSFGVQLLISFVFSIFLIALGILCQATSTGWELPSAWINQAVAAGAEAPTPYSLEGVITIAGVAFGFTAGYAWWQKKFGKPEIKASSIKRLARYLIGLLGILALYIGLKYIFPQEPIIVEGVFRFVRYALIGVWVSAAAPLLFKKLHLE